MGTTRVSITHPPFTRSQWDSSRTSQGFLLQLDLYLATIHPAPSGHEKVSALVSCIFGKAMEWANTVWGEGDVALDHLEDFTSKW
jgi:hypothetical protein